MADEVRHVARANQRAVQTSLREVVRRLRGLIRTKQVRAVICFVWVEEDGEGRLRELVSCTEAEFRMMVERLPDTLARLAGHMGVARERAAGRIKGEA